MSKTNLLSVNSEGEILSYAEYINSWGASPCILDIIQLKLELSSWDGIYKNISKLSDNEKILLRFFNHDNIVFYKDTIDLLIDALEEFDSNHNEYFRSLNRIYHINKITEDIIKIKNSDFLIGVALNATSLGDCDLFEYKEISENESRPFNVFKDRHYKFNMENFVTKWRQ